MDFKKALPIIIALRNPSLKPRHYSQLKLLIGHDLLNDNQKITMSVLLEADVFYIYIFNFKSYLIFFKKAENYIKNLYKIGDRPVLE